MTLGVGVLAKPGHPQRAVAEEGGVGFEAVDEMAGDRKIEDGLGEEGGCEGGAWRANSKGTRLMTAVNSRDEGLRVPSSASSRRKR
jgi:hypothetical protein